MTYKGYSASIGYDDEDGIFTGHIAGIQDGVGFHADTLETLRAAFNEAVNDYIETCQRIGKLQSPPLTARQPWQASTIIFPQRTPP
jgi:predicted HicB family RNase H-like nuclease